jgi:hypothetical protein
MRREGIGSNVVVVAQHFNPSVVNHLWLVRHGLMAEEELEPGSIFVDGLVQVCTRRFILLVTPEQLQIVPRVTNDEQDVLITNAIGTIVRTLPHTPFRALGLNFTWHLVPDEGDVRTLTRRLFYIPHRPLFQDFDVPDANFGAYLSKNIFGYRLKLDAKPVTVPMPEGPSEDRLQILFNYHADLPQEGEAATTIEGLLGHWRQAAEESRRIVGTIQDGGDS